MPDIWVKPERMPRHVAIIMDGNGRWAKKRGLPRALGHRAGVEAMRAIIRESSDLGVEVLSLYAFSTENWKRSTEEVGVLMGLLLEFCGREVENLYRNNVRIRILGDVERMPEPQRTALKNAMERTAGRTGLQLNFAINYGGRDELRRAAQKLCEQALSGALRAEEVTEETLRQALDTAGQPDVDLVIRTSGEERMSNFLPFQTAYAELQFPKILWPDFGINEYHAALDDFAARDRRFGGRSEK